MVKNRYKAILNSFMKKDKKLKEEDVVKKILGKRPHLKDESLLEAIG
jgi:hypothetical protein